MKPELTSTELDVAAVAEMRLREIADHPGDDFVVKADMAQKFLASIVLMAARLRDPLRVAERQPDDPIEYWNYRMRDEQRVRRLLAMR